MFLFRLLVYLISFFIFVFAVVLLAIGIIMGVIPGTEQRCIIAYGAIIALVSIIVTCTVCTGFRLGNFLLVIILTVGAIFQIVTGVTVIAMENFIRDLYEVKIGLIYKLNKEDSFSRKIVDDVQQTLQCCGFSGRQDSNVRENNGLLYVSCCDKTVKVCTKFKAYKEACEDTAIDFMVNMLKIVGCLFICFGVVEVALAFILCCFPL